jgi:hypothetical protein
MDWTATPRNLACMDKAPSTHTTSLHKSIHATFDAPAKLSMWMRMQSQRTRNLKTNALCLKGFRDIPQTNVLELDDIIRGKFGLDCKGEVSILLRHGIDFVVPRQNGFNHRLVCSNVDDNQILMQCILHN